ncbi:MAG: membrane protein insertion efficiency factor YidD [Candidatus Cloacimonadota bacterium]|nr:membrane protein insertion efficiency factor YidD [Candidatus Cloacimonadota bacterium]
MKKIVIILIICILNIIPVYSKLNSPEDFKIQSLKNTDENITNPFVVPFYFFVRFYQVAISPIKQDNCQMYPSCSHYSIISLSNYGFVGVLMTVDRLNRCGHDVQYYDKVIIGNRIKYYDPVKVIK